MPLIKPKLMAASLSMGLAAIDSVKRIKSQESGDTIKYFISALTP